MLRRSVSLALFVLAAVSLTAQLRPLQTSLSGRLTDRSSEAVEGATVSLFQSTTFQSWSTTSDRDGFYRFVNIPSGQYEITVHKNGWGEAKQSATLHAGETVDRSMQLSASTAKAPAGGISLIFSGGDLPGNAGTSLLSNPSASVRELQVLNELEPLSAYTMPAPESGLSRLHGELYGMMGKSLLGFNSTQSALLPFMEYGASLGGSTASGRSGFFLSYDQNTLDQNRFLSALAATSMLPSNLLTAAPREDNRSLLSSQLRAALDRQLSSKDSADLRFSRSELKDNSMLANVTGNTRGLDTLQHTGRLDNTAALSPNLLNTTRAQFLDTKVDVPSDMPALGIDSSVATRRRYRVYEVADNVYRQMGKQSLQAGGSFLYRQMNLSFLEGSMGNASFRQASRGANFYAVNQWKMRPDFTLTTGVNYDLQYLKGMQTDSNNFAPQVGFAWSPGGAKGTVVRGGFGMTYEQVPLPAIAGVTSGDASQVSLLRSGSFAASRNSLPANGLGSYTTLDPAMQRAYVEQANLEVEQQLGSRSSLIASYQHAQGVQLPTASYRAAASCSTTVETDCATNYAIPITTQYTSGSTSSYNGFTLAFAQHPVSWGDYKVAYTYASAQSSGDELLMDNMRRVSLVGSLHTSAEPGVGLWQQVSRGLTLTGYGDATGHNNLPGVEFMNVRAQLSKQYQLGSRAHLDFLAETFNMFQHRSYSKTQAGTDLGDYGNQIMASYEHFTRLIQPNGSQIGARLRF